MSGPRFLKIKADAWYPNGESSPIADRYIAVAAVESIEPEGDSCAIIMRSGVYHCVPNVDADAVVARLKDAAS